MIKNLFLLSLCYSLLGCKSSPEPYPLPQPAGFVRMLEPNDNITTYEGIALGRKLFFDPKLSNDQDISCSHCHRPELGFTDGLALSQGNKNLQTNRSAPSLLNIGFHYKGVFWDGRSPTLEDQALHPITNQKEMGFNWIALIEYLNLDKNYPELFEKAFGNKDISKELVAKALAQFQRSLVSYNSKYDQVLRKEKKFTNSEKRGWSIFFDTGYPNIPMGECSHCHTDPLFTNLSFANIGLDSSSTLMDFKDNGLGEISGQKYDNGKFKIPSLRNIAITAPYMHDGRFETLEEVIDHYNSGGHYAENVDPNVRPLGLTETDKTNLLHFLNTLTDSIALQDPSFYEQ